MKREEVVNWKKKWRNQTIDEWSRLQHSNINGRMDGKQKKGKKTNNIPEKNIDIQCRGQGFENFILFINHPSLYFSMYLNFFLCLIDIFSFIYLYFNTLYIYFVFYFLIHYIFIYFVFVSLLFLQFIELFLFLRFSRVFSLTFLLVFYTNWKTMIKLLTRTDLKLKTISSTIPPH